MQLFYSEQLTADTTTYTFTREESKHIVKVLRKRLEDTVHITNGRGFLFTSQIVNDNPNKCTVAMVEHKYHQPKPYKLHIAIAPTKLNDRFEWFLEKATEVGISEITPLLCDHSERKTIKWERYNKILQSALKQSLQYHLPILNPLTPFKNFLEKTDSNSLNCIAHCEEGEKQMVSTQFLNKNHITILIGPEGDFSLQEIKNAIAHQYKEITLGTTRLRTETAGIVACCRVDFLKN